MSMEVMSTINNTTSITGDGANNQDSSQSIATNTNTGLGANHIDANALQQLQQLQQQLSVINASAPQPPIPIPSSASIQQSASVNNVTPVTSTLSVASSAIPSTEGPFSTSLPASFLAALVQASNNSQLQQQAKVSAAPQAHVLQALVQTQADVQAQAQAGLASTESPPSLNTVQQHLQQPLETNMQLSPATSLSTISSPGVSTVGGSSSTLSFPAIIDSSQLTEIAQVPPQSLPQKMSASDLFLQQQIAAQREVQKDVQTTPKTKGKKSPKQQQSPSSQRQQSKPTPVQAQTPKMSQPSINPTTPEGPLISPLNSGSPPANANQAKQPAANPNQLQHDLKQLQLHNQRQAAEAAAAAAAAASTVTEGEVQATTGVPSQDSSVNDAISQLLGASSSSSISSTDIGGSSEVQGSNPTQQSPNTTNIPEALEPAALSIESPNINNDSGQIIMTYPGVGAVLEGAGTPRLGTPAGSDTTTSLHNDGAIETPQIFKATYSGVPVFEMSCRGVAVMRRRSDSYLNATQILKVAEFDKPQRTRILEREVQKGEHEKVQGGYGKYQGTWVPYERGLQLCQEYNVLHILRPLLEYQSSKVNSPPLAPKHVTAASLKPRKPREPRNPVVTKIKKAKKGSSQTNSKLGTQGPIMGVIDGSNVGGDGSIQTFADEDVSTSELDDDETHSRAGSEASMDETMSILSAQSRTPSPIGSRLDLSSSEISDGETFSPSRRRQRSMERSPRSRKKQHNRPGDELFIGYHGSQGRQSSSQQQAGYHSPRIQQDIEMRSRDEPHSPSLRQSSPRRRRGHAGSWQEDHSSNTDAATASSNQGHYAETLLEYFISDATTLPSILTHPPSDLDFDLIIDEEGHTPLHWAVAMAKTKIVKLLVQHGADIYRVNNQGQTALMRSVLFTNNFDMKTFPSLLEILQKTIFTIDKNDQTVFHHVAVTAGMRGKVHASRYYMECLLEKLAQHPQELASIINVQDVVGDTALIIAARIGNKKVVKLLLDAGADSKIRNKSGRNADEYILDAENQTGGPSSSALPPSLHTTQQQYQQTTLPPATVAGAAGASHNFPPQSPHHQITGLGNNNNPQRVTLSVSQQQQHRPSSMAPSASPIPSRMHGHASPNLHGLPSPNLHTQSLSTIRSVTPPLSRHIGQLGSSSSMDRIPNVGYQDYSPIPRDSFQSQPLPLLTSSSLPHYGNHLEPHTSHSFKDPSNLRDYTIQSGYNLKNEARMDINLTSTLTRDSSALAQQPGSNGRPSQRMIPAVTELFEQLTHSYEKDLYEKEQDLMEARNLLHSIQAEIQEGQRTIEELRSKTMYLGQAEEQVRTLENMIRQEINLRQRLNLESLITQEESRLKQEKDLEKGKQGSIGTTELGTPLDLEQVLKLEKEAAELRTSLAQLQQGRKDQVEQIVQLKSQQGKRRHEYKRLIALCCNVSIDEVDDLLGPLLSTLGSEDAV
ncbi:hypothetical protein BGZ49_010716 [Haplosporangium sp. Z 27]|nr:hypothetical protein BGZ49_010716 [Haplosporangium sp. Z 27]